MSFNYSLIIDDGSSPDDPLFWSRPTPIDCNPVRIVGIFLCVAALVGIVCNGALFHSFVRYKALRSPPNIFVMFIAGMGLVASCTILPLTGTSSIYCHWLYHRTGCLIDAVIAFLYGCSSVYLLCGVSLSRCYIIIRPLKAKDITVNKCILISIVAMLIAFLWTMLPLMGWNEYTIEGARISCCVNWYDHRVSYVAFLFFIFIMVYVIPLVVLITANTITWIGLKRMNEKLERGMKTVLSKKRVEMERRIIKSIMITTCGFIFTWTPYAVTFLASAFQGKDFSVSPLITFLATCFAKSSVIWIPLLYISTSTQYQLSFVNQGALDQGSASNRVDATLTNVPALARKEADKKMASSAAINNENKELAVVNNHSLSFSSVH